MGQLSILTTSLKIWISQPFWKKKKIIHEFVPFIFLEWVNFFTLSMPITWISIDYPVPVDTAVCHCCWTLIAIQEPVIPENIFVKPDWFSPDTQDLGIQMTNPSLQELNKPHSWAQIWKTLQIKHPTQYTQQAKKSPRYRARTASREWLLLNRRICRQELLKWGKIRQEYLSWSRL